MRAPVGLRAAGRRLWDDIAGSGQYELRPDEFRIVEDAAREADLIDTLNRGLSGQKLVVRGSMGQDVINPLISELRQHRATLAGLLARLKLPDVDGSSGGNQQRAAAQSRWAAAHGSRSA